MPWIDREGDFRALPTEAVVLKSPRSGAVGLTIRFDILEAKIDLETGAATEDWQDWKSCGMQCEGTFWIIKSDGAVHEKQAAAIRDMLGWDGNLGLDNWQPHKCQINVVGEQGDSRTFYRAQWINDWDSTGVAKKLEPCDPDTLRNIKNQYGPQLRAFFGQKNMGPSSPPDKPTPNSVVAKSATTADTASPSPPEQKEVPAESAKSTKEEAWTAWSNYRDKIAPEVTSQQLADLWLLFIDEYGGEAKMTPASWHWMTTAGIKKINDDIPF